MKRRKLKTQLKKYLSKTASPAEEYIMESWYESFNNDPEECDSFRNLKVLQDIKDEIFSKALKKENKKKGLIRNLKRISIAASLLIAGGLGLYFLPANDAITPKDQNEIAFHKIQTQFGQRKEITLSDGTIITLNANSEIRIDNDFNKNNRKVILDGEAFFQVARDTMSVFVVETPGLNIRVLGTSFNLKSRKELKRETLQVYTGKVQVDNPSTNLGILEREHQLIYDRNSQQTLYSEMPENKEPNWKSGHTILDNASFQELENEFLNRYGIHLKSENSDVLSKRYNITLRSLRTLEESVDVLCEIIDKKYRKEGDNIIIY